MPNPKRKLFIDARALQQSQYSGISNYTKEIISTLREVEDLDLVLFTSGKRIQLPFSRLYKRIHVFWPSKIISLGCLLRLPLFSWFIDDCSYAFFPQLQWTIIPKKIPTILMVHDVSFLHQKETFSWHMRMWHKLIDIKEQLSAARYIIVPSEQTKRDLITFYSISKEKITVIPHGVSVRNATPPVPKQKYILSVATNEPRKNLDAMLLAYKKSNLPKRGISCILIGAAGWKNPVKDVHDPNIQYLGYVSQQEKESLIAGALSVVYPSLYEGFGLPVLEAFSFGTPVITSANSSLVEVGDTLARYVHPYSISSMIYAMNTISDAVSDDDALKRMEYASQFTWKSSAEKLVSLLDNYEI